MVGSLLDHIHTVAITAASSVFMCFKLATLADRQLSMCRWGPDTAESGKNPWYGPNRAKFLGERSHELQVLSCHHNEFCLM